MTMISRSPSLILIDPAVQDYQHLLHGVSSAHEVLILDSERNSIDQITQALADRQDLESLHIVAHATPGQLWLGGAPFNLHTLEQSTATIQGWTKAFAQKATIFLYGCQVAAGKQGQALVQRLHELTNAAVAASTQFLGNSDLGGTGTLDFTVGEGQFAPIFGTETLTTYPHVLAVLLSETFSGADVLNLQWIFGTGTAVSANPFLTARTGTAPSAPGGLPGAVTALDTAGNGALRLTNNSNNQASFVIYNSPLATSAGLTINFDFFAYNGNNTVNPSLPAGADGISFFLIDGTQSPTTAGAFGGSLGYAQKIQDGIPGIAGGFIGVGLDEFGNFSSIPDFAGGPNQRVGGGTSAVPDSVSVRGGQQTGYQFVAGSGTLPGQIDNVTATTRTDAARGARIDITPTGILSVKIDLNNDGDFLDLGEAPSTLGSIDIVAANGGAIPASFKFGFASSTGDSTNIHEVRNLTISSFSTPPTVTNVTVGVTPNTIVNLTGLSGADGETPAASLTFTTTSLPSATQGTLFLGNPLIGGTPITIGQTLTSAQLTQLFFRAQPGFTGETFTYRATDTDGDISPVPGVVTLTPLANQPPVTTNTTVGVTPGTPANITSLPATDPDGTITSYTIVTSPPATQGQLFLGNPSTGTRVTTGQVIPAAQIGQLFFQPAAGFTGTAFTFTATDNLGALDSTPATVNLIRLTPPQPPILPPTPDTCEDGVTRRGNNRNNTLIGTPDSDRLLGRNGNDTLRGRDCNDLLDGGRGNDQLFGENDRDRLLGRQNNDQLDAGNGNDRLVGGLGRDRLRGRAGDDTILGSRGNDRLNGGGSDDILNGQVGRDQIRGGSGDDAIRGEQQDDRITGNRGNDILSGGLQKDLLRGQGGSDRLDGNRGNDRVNGGSQDDVLAGAVGNDFLIGGGGVDTMAGGNGRDRFVYRNAQHGADTILDFTPRDQFGVRTIFEKGDYSRTPRFDRYIRLVQSGSDTRVRIDANGDRPGGFTLLATLTGVSATSLGASNFVV